MARLVELAVYAAAVVLWAAWSFLEVIAGACGALARTVFDAEKNRVAARSASGGRGGQSASRPPALPPRPVSRPDTPIGSLARDGRLDSPPADRHGPLSDDETAAACRRLIDLHGLAQ